MVEITHDGRRGPANPPSDEETAAIAAALEVAWPAVPPSATSDGTPSWRFSGRGWRGPISARRERPPATWPRDW